ncbi:arabinogalactan endo-1,4-beta-galactosidase [Eubacterium uniforme]|uniref:Arabinogalactan endo-beta-1,4-galactanase n=1 Tax=Eubacterium uniforme TaxID=39495 RepID=A0A1T4V505_9FIRM|nr:glycosyl hydrolase 53 family protein [Eubacterium uniforme]SKA60013.1 arabinogalactan endo-1,4-beta-galactosidase [Eubacterium uniforme]
MVEFIKGMDVSTLKELEECGAKYFDENKEKEVLEILKDYGCNYVRIRLWNDPYDENNNPYGAGTNDLDTLIYIAKKAKALGMGFLLDFHYSDFWTDPGKQNIPKAWRGMDINHLSKSLYNFTYETLKKLESEKVFPTMIQVGNELTNGLLWPVAKYPNFKEITMLINSGIDAVRSISEDVPIMIHLDCGGNNEKCVEWFDNYIKNDGGDFQIIGLSYYPFWQGGLDKLKANVDDLAKRYNKPINIVELGMGFTTEDYADKEGLSDNERKGMAATKERSADVDYPMTKEGQSDFIENVLEIIKDIPNGLGNGFFYWEPAWIPIKGSGWANKESLKYINDPGPCGNEWANQALFDYDGNALPSLKVIRDFSV